MPKSPLTVLREEIEASKGSFLIIARCELRWDWTAFRRLTRALFEVADQTRGSKSVELWVAEAFWFCDTWIKDWTGHPNFPRPAEGYDEAIELLHDLSYYFFMGESPYQDDTLKRRCLPDGG